jgi:hypothetical protein
VQARVRSAASIERDIRRTSELEALQAALRSGDEKGLIR